MGLSLVEILVKLQLDLILFEGGVLMTKNYHRFISLLIFALSILTLATTGFLTK